MKTVDEINAELEVLWTRFFHTPGQAYAPMYYKPPKSRSLLFVGLNPSFSERGWKTLLRKVPGLDIEPHKVLAWPSPQDFNIDLSHKLEAHAREHYPYYKPHDRLARELKMEWEHVDLFAYRETRQARTISLMVERRRDVKLTEFGKAQLKLFIDWMYLADPAAVIVINALAARIYSQNRALTRDREAGHYWDDWGSGRKVPVFFSGMLTGARALDRFSVDRLFWHVAKSLGRT